MIDFSPKEQFKKYQGDSAEKLGLESESKWLKTSLTFSLAELAHNGASQDELRGAARLIAILTNLSTNTVEKAKYPLRVLKTFDQDFPKKDKEK